MHHGQASNWVMAQSSPARPQLPGLSPLVPTALASSPSPAGRSLQPGQLRHHPAETSALDWGPRRYHLPCPTNASLGGSPLGGGVWKERLGEKWGAGHPGRPRGLYPWLLCWPSLCGFGACDVWGVKEEGRSLRRSREELGWGGWEGSAQGGVQPEVPTWPFQAPCCHTRPSSWCAATTWRRCYPQPLPAASS